VSPSLAYQLSQIHFPSIAMTIVWFLCQKPGALPPDPRDI